jgi:ABC-2 type transport system ATP-binding protein
MPPPVIVLEQVTKRFAGHTAVESLSLEVPGGGIYGLLGRNGAGKTTTLRIILGILTPDEGRITLFGDRVSGRSVSSRIGYLPEERGLYRKMRVLDQLVFLGEAKGISRARARRLAREWLARLELGDWANRRVEDLSKGMQQKVQFIGAILHEPELVILDEPFSGLDPVSSKVMKDVVVDLARSGRTVLFSTHIMEQAERMCDRIAILADGRKVVDGVLADIKRAFGTRHVALSFTRNASQAGRVLEDRSLAARVEDYGASAEVELAEGASSDDLLRALMTAGVGLGRFELVEPSLHAIFVAQVGPDPRASIETLRDA